MDEECKRTKSELDTLLKEEKLVGDYLEKNVPSGWLGVYVALAWANVTHRTFRVWRSKGKDQVVFIEGLSCISGGDTDPIDIYHTGNHYERLTRQEAPLFTGDNFLPVEGVSELSKQSLTYSTYSQSPFYVGFLNKDVVYFKPLSNTGMLNRSPGSCGFISLGTDRDKLMQDLSPAVHDNAEIRDLIGQQIYNDFRNYRMAQDDFKMEQNAINRDPRFAMALEEKNWERLRKATQAYDNTQSALNDLITHLRSIHLVEQQTSPGGNCCCFGFS